jgi:hypothetical protein
LVLLSPVFRMLCLSSLELMNYAINLLQRKDKDPSGEGIAVVERFAGRVSMQTSSKIVFALFIC